MKKFVLGDGTPLSAPDLVIRDKLRKLTSRDRRGIVQASLVCSRGTGNALVLAKEGTVVVAVTGATNADAACTEAEKGFLRVYGGRKEAQKNMVAAVNFVPTVGQLVSIAKLAVDVLFVDAEGVDESLIHRWLGYPVELQKRALILRPPSRGLKRKK